MINSALMRHQIPLILFLLISLTLSSQNIYETREGKVSYITSHNVYVKFTSTDHIAVGDTLFISQNGTSVPAVIVKEISSISSVCVPVSSLTLKVGDSLLTRQNIPVSSNSDLTEAAKTTLPSSKPDSGATSSVPKVKRIQRVTGNFSVASYFNSSNVAASSERMRYTFSMVAQNLGNSRFSVETYISFAHTVNQWIEIKKDLFNGLKIYGLALNYDINNHNTIWLGRRINPRISNAGAIDGIQYEGKAGNFTAGLIAGTRPDNLDYRFNANLLQAGAYIAYDLTGKNGSMQTTLAVMEQRNHGMTDRRFTYLQHSNSIFRNLYFFGSAEVDLYKKTMNPVDPANTLDTTYKKDYSPRLSNVYLSLRYRPFRQLSLSVSYSARENVIYYETYKTIVDRLLESATVQGYSFQVSYQPVKLLSIGLNASYRDSKTDPRPSRNLYGYLTYNRIPGIGVAATLSATTLETSYMTGKIYSLGISRDLIAGILSAGLDYRYVSYKFYGNETMPLQQMGEFNMMWRMMKKLSLAFFYEGTLEQKSTFNRLYVNLTQRF